MKLNKVMIEEGATAGGAPSATPSPTTPTATPSPTPGGSPPSAPSTPSTPPSQPAKPNWHKILGPKPSEAPTPTPSTPPVSPTPPATPTEGSPVPPGSPTPEPVAPTPPPTNIVPLDEAGIAKLVEGVRSAVAPAAAQPAQPQYTQEQLNKMFNVFGVDEGHLSELGIEATPERVAIFNTILQGVAKQAATVAQFQIKFAMEQAREQLAPMMEHFQTMQAEAMHQRFYKKYANLKDYEPLLLSVKDAFVASGKKFDTEDEAFKAVADEALRLLKEMGITPGVKPAAPASGGGANPPSMPTLSGGGQGGAGDQSKAKAGTPNWRKVYRS